MHYANCNANYIGKTTSISEYLGKGKTSHVYEHLMSKLESFTACFKNCFSTLDTANTRHQLRVNKGLFLHWKNLL